MNKYTNFVFTACTMILIGILCLPIFSVHVYASTELELMKIAIGHLNEDMNEAQNTIEILQTELNTHIQNDVNIVTIEKTGTSGTVDTYTITMTDGSTYTFTIKNGKDGKDGITVNKGKDGKDGKNGVNGKDGKNGTNGKDGKNGTNGKDGKDGVGISKIEKTATNGNQDTYTITLTDDTTYDFTVTNGQDGKDGKDGTDAEIIELPPVDNSTSSPTETIALVIASIALLGNVIMAAFMIKNKKK